MQMTCPHCQSPLAVESVTALAEVVCPACGSSVRLDPAATAAWSPREGQRKLGKFELLDAVGFGAFGTVYKAHDPELDRIVAIKVPRAANLATADDLNRFLREARSVARLRHPSIVPVYEVGQADGLPYLVSEFIQGMTLSDLLTARRPAPDKAAALLAEVADALQYAHDQGVIHRDVKPSNILLDNDNHPHLMDFGLAKRDAGEVTMTLDGQVLGTPAYMSPEQASGEAHQVDGRSDIYSLGVILYQLLTGELPFKGNVRALLHQVQHEEPPRPRSLVKDIPRDLETICRKAMAREPQQRYATARALAEDLRRYLAGEPIQARPPGVLERTRRWLKRRRVAIAGVLGAVALSAVVGVAVYLARPEKGVPEPTPRPTSSPSVAATPVSPADGSAGATPASAPIVPIALPDDLALVPADCVFFATVRVADMLAQEGVKRLEKLLAKYDELKGPATAQVEFEKAWAQKPAEVERLTWVWPDAGDSHVTFVTTRVPYGRDQVLHWLGTAVREEKRGERSYYFASPPRRTVVHFLTERIFVLAESEASLRKLLERGPSTDGEHRATLALALQRYQGAVGVNAQAPVVRSQAQFLTTNLVRSFAALGPKDLEEKLRPFSEAQSATLLFNLRSALIAGDKLQLRLRLDYADAQRAWTNADNLGAAVAAVQKPLRQMVEVLVKMPGLIPANAVTGNSDMFKLILRAYDQLSLALQDVEIQTEGQLVDVRLAELALDLAEIGTAMGEQARLEKTNQALQGELHAPHLVQIGLALADYTKKHGRLPPPAVTALDGRPLLSWRVALLPYLGEQELYEQFRLDQAWDTAENKKLLERMPAVYGAPKPGPGSGSVYHIFGGPGTAFDDPRGVPLAEFKEALARTVAVVATIEAAPWTRPTESLARLPLPRMANLVVCADGSLGKVSAGIDDKTRLALFMRNKEAAAVLTPLPVKNLGVHFNAASWEIARQPKARAEQYRWGVRLAEKACALAPDDGNTMNTLGVAQYRAGHFPDALATLTRCEQRNKATLPATAAFLAMTQHQLGQHEPARAALQRLRALLQDPARRNDRESRGFLDEAATLLEGASK